MVEITRRSALHLKKPYYSAQHRICYKHRKWIVDGTDLRTFRCDHAGAGGQLVIELSVC